MCLRFATRKKIFAVSIFCSPYTLMRFLKFPLEIIKKPLIPILFTSILSIIKIKITFIQEEYIKKSPRTIYQSIYTKKIYQKSIKFDETVVFYYQSIYN